MQSLLVLLLAGLATVELSPAPDYYGLLSKSLWKDTPGGKLMMNILFYFLTILSFLIFLIIFLLILIIILVFIFFLLLVFLLILLLIPLLASRLQPGGGYRLLLQRPWQD